jgi:ABC-type nitrate/sulfonate/bicarbonate transport system ATPase subunit
MEGELLTLWESSKKTEIFVTHDLEEAIALADEVIVLSAGPASRVVARHAGDARAAARSDGTAHVAGVRRHLSLDLGRAPRGSVRSQRRVSS